MFRNIKGQSLLEVIVAMAIFGLLAASMITLALGGFTGLEQGGEHIEADALAQEGIEAIRAIRDGAFNELSYTTSSVSLNGGAWEFDGEGVTEQIGQYTRTISFEEVCRDGNDDITACPGAYRDVETVLARVEVSWPIRFGLTNSVERIAYITNWDSVDWIQTNWASGDGQDIWSDETQYSTDSGTVDVTSSPGDIRLTALSGDEACGTQIWPFSNEGLYTYNPLDIEITGGVAQLVATTTGGGGGENGTGINPDFTTNASGWNYVDWSESGNRVDGTYQAIGGNPLGYINIIFDKTKNATLAGYWEQAFTTTIDTPVIATTTFDWIVSQYDNSFVTSFELFVFVDSAPGAPTIGQEVWSSGQITGVTSWEGVSAIDISNKLPTAGTYYLKVAAEVITTGGGGPATGQNIVGFDNVEVFWSGEGGGGISYPTNVPDIQPTTSLVAATSSVLAWTAFTETATKNSGEIYYQLSSDGGSTWQYWNGTVWANAGAGNYNVASVINANIGSFATSTGNVRFRAFLESDGSTQVQLDEVRITCEQYYDWSFTEASSYIYPTSSIEVSGGVARLLAAGVSGETTDPGFDISNSTGRVYGFNTPASYTYNPEEIEVTGGVAQLVPIITNGGGGASGGTTNPNFTANANGWTYVDWSESGNRIAGNYQATGGNPSGYINIVADKTKSATLAGYWQQPFTTTVNDPTTATAQLDWIVSQYSSSFVSSFRVYVFVDTAPGAPTVGQQVWSSGLITGATSWASVPAIDIKSKIPTAGTYYLKVAVQVVTTGGGGQASGQNIVGFDNVSVSWVKDSVPVITYPTTRPAISPLISYYVPGIVSWDSFTETAIKNSGQIYYQLSSDGGSTWQYWNGATWASAGVGNYNVASIVNTNISSFTVSTERIAFRAFLESSGSTQVQLDQIQITNTPGPAIWSFGSWDVGVGEQQPVGTIEGVGGNPDSYAAITIPYDDGGQQVGGYWEQSFTTTEDNPTVTIDFDYIVSGLGAGAAISQIRLYIDSASGAPTTQVGTINANSAGSWTGATQVDASSAVTTAGTYYLKMAYWVETGATGCDCSVGFDNVVLRWIGGSYPTNLPAISPSSPFSTAGVSAWSSFTETANKNGGEIYYQLSTDGLSWQYWNGGSWVSAGVGDYNVAEDVNTYITQFSTSTSNLTFRAFFESDGTQLVELDTIRVGWGEFSGGGGGSGYETSGYVLSSAFDMGDISPVQVVSWDQTIPSCSGSCTIQLQLRSAPDNGGVPGIWTNWFGETGLGSYFTRARGTLVPTGLNGNQWIQYRAELVGDGSETPVLREVRINYK